MNKTCTNCYRNGVYGIKGWCLKWNADTKTCLLCKYWLPGKEFFMDKHNLEDEHTAIIILTEGRKEVRCGTCDSPITVDIDLDIEDIRCGECGSFVIDTFNNNDRIQQVIT